MSKTLSFIRDNLGLNSIGQLIDRDDLAAANTYENLLVFRGLQATRDNSYPALAHLVKDNENEQMTLMLLIEWVKDKSQEDLMSLAIQESHHDLRLLCADITLKRTFWKKVRRACEPQNLTVRKQLRYIASRLIYYMFWNWSHADLVEKLVDFISFGVIDHSKVLDNFSEAQLVDYIFNFSLEERQVALKEWKELNDLDDI